MSASLAALAGWAAAHKSWLAFPFLAIAVGAVVEGLIAVFDYAGAAYGIGLLSGAIGTAIFVIVRGAAWGRVEWRKAAAGDALSRIEALEKGSREKDRQIEQAAQERGELKREAAAANERYNALAVAFNERTGRTSEAQLVGTGYLASAPMPEPEDSVREAAK